MAIIQSDKEIDLLFTDLSLFGKSKAACSSVGHSQRHARKRRALYDRTRHHRWHA